MDTRFLLDTMHLADIEVCLTGFRRALRDDLVSADDLWRQLEEDLPHTLQHEQPERTPYAVVPLQALLVRGEDLSRLDPRWRQLLTRWLRYPRERISYKMRHLLLVPQLAGWLTVHISEPDWLPTDIEDLVVLQTLSHNDTHLAERLLAGEFVRGAGGRILLARLCGNATTDPNAAVPRWIRPFQYSCYAPLVTKLRPRQTQLGLTDLDFPRIGHSTLEDMRSYLQQAGSYGLEDIVLNTTHADHPDPEVLNLLVTTLQEEGSAAYLQFLPDAKLLEVLPEAGADLARFPLRALSSFIQRLAILLCQTEKVPASALETLMTWWCGWEPGSVHEASLRVGLLMHGLQESLQLRLQIPEA